MDVGDGSLMKLAQYQIEDFVMISVELIVRFLVLMYHLTFNYSCKSVT